MPRVKVVFYMEEDGTCPLLDWMDGLSGKVRDKCTVRIERLSEMGYALRRPEADFLRDGIYELGIGHQGLNYRILYFFHGNTAAVVSHGIVKERIVPVREIDIALGRKNQFAKNPKRHTYGEDAS